MNFFYVFVCVIVCVDNEKGFYLFWNIGVFGGFVCWMLDEWFVVWFFSLCWVSGWIIECVRKKVGFLVGFCRMIYGVFVVLLCLVGGFVVVCYFDFFFEVIDVDCVDYDLFVDDVVGCVVYVYGFGEFEVFFDGGVYFGVVDVFFDVCGVEFGFFGCLDCVGFVGCVMVVE